MDVNGVSVAFSSYAIAGVISMLTAAVMAIAVKIIEHNNRKNEGKK
jgi:hypothetical protein